ncbi:MAG: putative DNA binding domain-containing protein [Candidatus Accumulibacter sp.]|nr:putative DNA binding domain-containing protein [Accumulibacter sp.]
MTETELLQLLTRGEDSRHQFKRDAASADSLAAELAAFANSGGGRLFLGVADDGSVAGLDGVAVRRLNQLLGNASSQHVRPPVHPLSENVPTANGIVMVVSVPDGLAKPYVDRQGRIWVKQGADKRHVTAREEMQRMFQRSGLVHADVVPVAGTSAADINEKSFQSYFGRRYGQNNEFAGQTPEQLLQNLGLGDGHELNLAGLMLFGQRPQHWRPAFEVKAVAFPGTALHDTRYLDSEDAGGTLLEQYQHSFAFIRRNLHHVQRGRGFNTLGELEIPETALEELLVNALIHRDYFTSASIRLMVFTDRVEIASPGHLPDSLSIEAICQGRTNRRNPTLTEHASQILPYRGMGSGIPRALKEWPRIELIDDVAGNQFRAVVWRPKAEWATPPVTPPVAPPVAPPVTPPVAPPVTPPVTPPVAALLALLAEAGELANADIRVRLKLKDRTHVREYYIEPALAQGLIEYTLPDKPSSRLQKYRLTASGQSWLQAMNKSKDR